MHAATLERLYRNALWTVFPSTSLSTAGVCIAHTDKDKVTPLCSDSSLNPGGHVRTWEASVIPAASRKQHCRSSKGCLQCPGSKYTPVNNAYKSRIIHSNSVNSSGLWVQSPHALAQFLTPDSSESNLRPWSCKTAALPAPQRC